MMAWYFIRLLHFDQILPLLNKNFQAVTLLPIKTEGNLTFKLFPFPALYLKHIEIGAPNSSSAYFIMLNDVSLKLNLRSLLKKEIIFNLIQAENFTITINNALPTLVAKDLSPETLDPKTLPTFIIEKIVLNHGVLNIHSPLTLLKIEDFHLTAIHANNTNPLFFTIKTNGRVHYELPSKNTISTDLHLTGQVSLSNIRSFAKNTITFNGILKANETYFNQFKIDQISAGVTIKPGNILLYPMVMGLYKGEGFGDIKIDTINNRLYINQTVHRLEGKNFLQHFIPISLIEGQVNFFIHGQCDLNSKSIMQTLTASGHFDLINSIIKNFNLHALLNLIREKIATLLKIIKTPTTPAPHSPKITTNPNIYFGETKVSLLKIQFSLQHQDLSFGQSLLQTDELKLTGTGRYNIATNRIIANLHATFDTGDKDLNDISNILGGFLPITVIGPIKNPNVTPNLDKISPYIQSLITKKITDAPQDVIKKQIFQFFTGTQSYD